MGGCVRAGVTPQKRIYCVDAAGVRCSRQRCFTASRFQLFGGDEKTCGRVAGRLWCGCKPQQAGLGCPIHSAHSTAAVTRPRCGHGGGLAGGAVFQSGCGHRVTRTARVRTRAVSTARHCTQWTPRPWCTRTACPHARRHAEARHFTRGCRPLHTWHSLRHVAGAWAGWLAGWLRCGSG